jgi:hypothetical protein
MCTGLSGLQSRSTHLGNGEQRFASQTGLMMSRLGAIAAVLRAASGLDRKQDALLNIHALLVFAMDGMSMIEKLEKGKTIQR